MGPAVRAPDPASQMWTRMRGRMDEQAFVLTEPLGLRLQSLQDVFSDLLTLLWLYVGHVSCISEHMQAY